MPQQEPALSHSDGPRPASSLQSDAQPDSLPLDGAFPVTLSGVAACLLPQRAVWLPQRRALLVADVHLGKAASFRALGVPVPGGTTAATLARLDTLVQSLAPDLLVVLGDLLHGPAAQRAAAVRALARWRATHARVDMVLVRGNHDDRAGDPPPECGIRALDAPWPIGPLALCHAPDDLVASRPCIAVRAGVRRHVNPKHPAHPRTCCAGICIRSSACVGAAMRCGCRASGCVPAAPCCRRSATSPAVHPWWPNATTSWCSPTVRDCIGCPAAGEATPPPRDDRRVRCADPLLLQPARVVHQQSTAPDTGSPVRCCIASIESVD
jgi:DNA ligase-associated metallophosphoesterase